MPFLEWEFKQLIINHDKDVIFRLPEVLKKPLGDGSNIFVEGDNLEALKSMLPHFQNNVKCIFIDPPYNTGEEKWIYNDNVTSPEMKKWIGRVVGPEGEDLNRHDKWLCMMYPRLKMLQKLLSNDGIIFVHIDDNEHANLKLIMDEIFHISNYITSFTVAVRYPGKTLARDSKIQKISETCLVYGNGPDSELISGLKDYGVSAYEWKVTETGKPTSTEKIGNKKVDIFKDGSYKIEKVKPSKENLRRYWSTGSIARYGGSSGEFGEIHLAPRTQTDGLKTLYKVYGLGDDRFPHRYFLGPKKQDAEHTEYFQGMPNDVYAVIGTPKEEKVKLPIDNFLDYADRFGNCRLEGGVPFGDGKKPIGYIQHLLKMAIPADDNDYFILDSFAGSGSTAHAVLEFNKERKNSSSLRKELGWDKKVRTQNNKFILVEIDKKVSETKTQKRLGNIYKEYGGNKQPQNGVRFLKLGQPLMVNGKLNPKIKYEDLAAHIFYYETSQPLNPKVMKKDLIGVFDDAEYYLLFGKGKNALDQKFYNTLDDATKKFVFAEKNLVTEDELEAKNITFRQLPYDVLTP